MTSHARPRVIIESPFRGDTPEDAARKLDYARECVADSIRRGENPYASHLFFPQVLSDALPNERALGIALGLEWAAVADFVAVYADLGISDGMRQGIEAHRAAGLSVTIRSILPPRQCACSVALIVNGRCYKCGGFDT